MNFYDILDEVEPGMAYNPYAGEIDGQWIDGSISIDFLNAVFGKYTTAKEMKGATTSEGLKLFFDYLVEQGELK